MRDHKVALMDFVNADVFVLQRPFAGEIWTVYDDRGIPSHS
jgi:hypothetical protein